MRKIQEIASIILLVGMIKKDGSQASGLTNITVKVVGPDGIEITGFTAPTITELGTTGYYIVIFPSNATVKAFATADLANPYHLVFSSVTTDVQPSPAEVWIGSKYSWELATAYDVWNYTTRTLSSLGTLVSDIWSFATRALTTRVVGVDTLPTVTEIEGSTALAKEVSLSRILGLTLENHYEHTIVRDAQGNKTSSLIEIYDSAANASTHDGTTGLVAKYQVTATYSNGLMTTFLTTKVL